MKSLKKFSKAFVVFSILIFIPASSYAIVDISAYGGYAFSGEIQESTTKSDMSGWQYGFYGHIHSGIPMLFTVGIGLFYQIAPMTIEYEEFGDLDATKTTVGLDAYVQIDLPFLPVLPYVRGGLGIQEKIEIEYETHTEVNKENFKSQFYGFGFSYCVFDAIVWDLNLFFEYLYTTSKQENDIEVTGNAINAGVKMAL